MKAWIAYVCLVPLFSVLGVAEPPLGFDTRENVDRSTVVLRSKGIVEFMEMAWSKNLSAPPIHSRYWLDRYCDEKQEEGRVEKARRDFGHELAVQIDRMAVEVHEKPLGADERRRIDWLLRFSRWILAPKHFENFRIASRVEEIATMSLVRIVADMNVPDADIDGLFSRFLQVRESAMIRADFLYEESQGAFDVRSCAKDESNDGCFENAWLPARNRALDKAEAKGIRFTASRREKLKSLNGDVAFFIDDALQVPGGIASNWDCQLFKRIGVYRVQARNLESIRKFHRFRKTMGGLPDLKLEFWEDPEESYREHYRKEWCRKDKDERLSFLASYASQYYCLVKNNSYMDDDTRDIVDANERMRLAMRSQLEIERDNLSLQREKEKRQRIWEIRQVKLRERREAELRNREEMMNELRKKWKARSEARKTKRQ